jgi:phosphoglycolate phosphatase
LGLVVFDLDGTLVDSRRDLADAANALIAERGGQALAVDQVAAMVGEGAALLVRRALRAANVERDDLPLALARFLHLYDQRLLCHTRLYEGTREALDQIAARTPVAVLTNKPQHQTERLLDGLDIRPLFHEILGGDSVHGRKPDPAGLNYLMAQVGASAERTIMIGDSVIDLRTARAAGTRACLVRYGFGFSTVEGELSGTELIAEHAADLVRLTDAF